jgi:iron complex outermembrane receptor protein
MKTTTMFPMLAGVLGLAYAGCGLAVELSEQDYFDEPPTILTVSRLAQPINETPGAVTIIDRETIRRSGARELVDVLRLVPGYVVAGFNGANPSASYHAPLDDYGVRNLVLIDGRPMYSAYYFGGTSRGMMGILLEDIDRVEVLRGANSAAFGANAMFGVINVITRNAADTHGVEVSVTGGTGGIKDNYARIGWGSEKGSFRLTAGRRADSGYGNAHDDKIVSQLHLRGDLRPAADQELMLAAGVTELAAGDGFANQGGNPERTINWRNTYLQGQWKRQLSESDEIKLTASFNEETLNDAFFNAPYSVMVSSSGHGRRLNLEFQHQMGLSPQLRAVWGAGYKYEDAVSPALYASGEAVSIHEERLFGNIEWRLHPQWLINVGGFAGRHGRMGSYFSPRLMANFLVAPDHTLRAGLTESSRTPTLFEMASDVRLYPPAFLGHPYRIFGSTGNVRPESLQSQEIGYFGNIRNLRLTLDVRAYHERMRDIVAVISYPNPTFPFQAPTIIDFVNSGAFKTRGLEYQLRWKPIETTELWINQAFERTSWEASADKPLPPTHSTTIAWFQKLSHGFDLSVIHHWLGAMTWNEARDTLPSRRRLDMRLAKSFRIGSTRAEAALTVQAANGSIPEYQTGTGFTFERRAFGSLRLEF